MTVLSGKSQGNLVAVLFTAFFLLGASIYNDYGICWDEFNNRKFGWGTYEYVFYGTKDPFVFEKEHGKTHGPAFELLLVYLEEKTGLQDKGDITLMRHFTTFLMSYAGLIVFYLLCKKHFNSRFYGLLGSLMLVLNPRVFSHSFYNSVDIVFMSVFIACTYTLIRFLDAPTMLNTSMHALACAILTDIRNVGVFMVFLTYLFFALELSRARPRREWMKLVVATIIVYTILVFELITLFWPYLWEDPVNRFIGSFKDTIKPTFNGNVRYLDGIFRPNELPWHYTFVWMLATIPLAVILPFLAGLSSFVFESLKNPAYTREHRNEWILVLCLFTPIILPVILKAKVFDGWRHHFFVYPALVFIALTGIKKIIAWTRKKRKNTRRIIMTLLAVLTLSSLAHTTYFMIEYHPFQHTYFNLLLGRDMERTSRLFEVEYWGIPYRKGLEYILENDRNEVINISVENYPGYLNNWMLPKEDRTRLNYVDFEDSTYFLTNLRDGRRYELPIVYSINVRGADILEVYRADGRENPP